MGPNGAQRHLINSLTRVVRVGPMGIDVGNRGWQWSFHRSGHATSEKFRSAVGRRASTVRTPRTAARRLPIGFTSEKPIVRSHRPPTAVDRPPRPQYAAIHYAPAPNSPSPGTLTVPGVPWWLRRAGHAPKSTTLLVAGRHRVSELCGTADLSRHQRSRRKGIRPFKSTTYPTQSSPGRAADPPS